MGLVRNLKHITMKKNDKKKVVKNPVVKADVVDPQDPDSDAGGIPPDPTHPDSDGDNDGD